MSDIKDGGCAFPFEKVQTRLGDGTVTKWTNHLGMPARHYLAAKAMPGLMAADLALPVERQMGREWVARQSFLMADAMLAEGKAS